MLPHSLRIIAAIATSLFCLCSASSAASLFHNEQFTKDALLSKRSQSPFFVDGKHIPGIRLDAPDSFAGLLPITQEQNDKRKLFFWWFPSAIPAGSDKVVIWLNGGPGCSSLEGMFQENGPFLLPSGTPTDGSGARLNPYSWHKLANVVYIEQPIGTGLTEGNPDAINEEDVAREFYGFLVNFFKEFPQLHGKKLYITGESYAGMYIPYIINHIQEKVDAATNQRNGINYQGASLTDPSFAGDEIQREIPALDFAKTYQKEIKINDTVLAVMEEVARRNGVTKYVEKNLFYPPKGPLTLPKQYVKKDMKNLEIMYVGALDANQCFDPYNISPGNNNKCPRDNDPLGFPAGKDDPSKSNFVNNVPGFKQYVHADPQKTWIECNPHVFVGPGQKDKSTPPGQNGILQRVIEKSPSGRTTILHGTMDGVLLLNGTLLAIQNMTWNGKQGFEKAPSAPLIVQNQRKGLVHFERNLTFLTVENSGHMVPEDQPAVAYKALEYLLGYIKVTDLAR